MKLSMPMLAALMVGACWSPPSRLGHQDGCLSACPETQICRQSVCASRIVEFDAPPVSGDDTSQPLFIARGPDDNLWITQFQTDQIVRMTPNGASTVFSLPLLADVRSGPGAIVAGPDGNLWFTEGARRRVGRITTGGVATELAEVAGAGATTEIGVGGDGKIWFIATPNIIGRVEQDDSITQFVLPDDGLDLKGITGGPDGNVWFTAGDQIVRMTPAGERREFALPSAAAAPLGITLGPDGNLWFTENGVGAIGRITPAGEVTEFVVPGFANVFHIAAGPDGNLWFTDQLARVGRITTTGTVTMFPLETNRVPMAIVEGPDGYLWFTEIPNKIARLDPP
jgi:virginiamycin B lyase